MGASSGEGALGHRGVLPIPTDICSINCETTTPLQQFWFETAKDGVVGGTVDIGAKAVCTIGRSSSCDVVLEHPSVSRQHAVLLHTCKGHVLFDLGSIHGTSFALPLPDSLDGIAGPSNHPTTERASPCASEDMCTAGRLQHIRRRLPKHEQVPLHEGQCLVFGASRKVFTLRCASSVQAATTAAAVSEESGSPCIQQQGEVVDVRVTPLELPPRRTMGVLSPMGPSGSSRHVPEGGNTRIGSAVDTGPPGSTVPVKRKRSVSFAPMQESPPAR